MTIPFDYHIHTNYSIDSSASMIEMCQAAIDKKIPEVGFCEHFDLVPEDPSLDFFRADAWWTELEHCRSYYQGSLTIRAGVELGEPHRFQASVKKLLAEFPWDYCIGALHWVGAKMVFDPAFFQAPPEQAHRSYFRELADMVIQSDFDILAHFDITKRYGFDCYGFYDPQSNEADIRAVLSACVKKELALEINTATLRRPVNQTTPCSLILTWYREEGGRRVTLGSDAHLPKHVGFGLEQAILNARLAGFEYLTSFKARKNTLVPLNLQTPP